MCSEQELMGFHCFFRYLVFHCLAFQYSVSVLILRFCCKELWFPRFSALLQALFRFRCIWEEQQPRNEDREEQLSNLTVEAKKQIKYRRKWLSSAEDDEGQRRSIEATVESGRLCRAEMNDWRSQEADKDQKDWHSQNTDMRPRKTGQSQKIDATCNIQETEERLKRMTRACRCSNMKWEE